MHLNAFNKYFWNTNQTFLLWVKADHEVKNSQTSLPASLPEGMCNNSVCIQMFSIFSSCVEIQSKCFNQKYKNWIYVISFTALGENKSFYIQTTVWQKSINTPKVASDLNTAFFILFNHKEENTSSEKTSAWCFWTLWSFSAESTIFYQANLLHIINWKKNRKIQNVTDDLSDDKEQFR